MNRKRLIVVILTVTMSLFLVSCQSKVLGSDKTQNESSENQTSGLESKQALQIIIQESPPFSFTQNGELTGFVAEIVKEIMKRQNITQDIEILPFKRGYDIVLKEPMTVLCGMTRTPEREALFKWVGPVAQVKTGFYVKKGNGVAITSLDDAKALKHVGVTLGYYTEQYLKNEGFSNIDATAYPEDMLEKLILGRSNAILTDNIAINGLLQTGDTESEDLEMVYEVMSRKSYLAFSLETPDAIVEAWQKALDDAFADGTVQAIYEKWLPEEPLPEKESQ